MYVLDTAVPARHVRSTGCFEPVAEEDQTCRHNIMIVSIPVYVYVHIRNYVHMPVTTVLWSLYCTNMIITGKTG